MATSLVLTVIGPDQPGLVEILSQTVAQHGGSWENSRMARLAGHFVGILEVRVPREQAAALSDGLHALERHGLAVVVEDSPASAAVEGSSHRVLKLDLVGQDRPGIILEISSALAAAEANVVELTSQCTSAPMSGEMLFSASVELHHPVAQAVDVLRDELEKIAADLMVDIEFDSDD